MRVLVVNNMVPFVRGGAEELADHLVANLNRREDVDAELIRIPFTWDPAERLLDEMLLVKALQLYNVDRVIALKFPAYLIEHSAKTIWLLHQHRQVYDLWEAGESNIPEGARGDEIRRLVTENDTASFARCRKIFVNSPITRDRLRRFNNTHAEILHPPLNAPEDFDGPISQKDYIFAGGRINTGKRQHLLIEAMSLTRADARLVIAGPPDSHEDADRLRQLVTHLELEHRVELRFGYRPREEISDLMRGALACAYMPKDEDSLGYVTMEAFACAKPVLTTIDSGGLLEIVADRRSGRVVAANTRDIANAIDGLCMNRALAEKWGQEGKHILSRKGLSWPNTIEQLLS